MRVLIVDDSVVFRSQIRSILQGVPGIEIVGVAANGKIALGKMEHSSVDLITLDIEMPVMDGLTTLMEMRRLGIKAKAIVFSAQSGDGANNAMKALHLGAVDFVVKPASAGSLEAGVEAIRQQLLPKIKQFSIGNDESSKSVSPVVKPVRISKGTSEAGRAYPPVDFSLLMPKVLLIGSSTGGPNALDVVFNAFKGFTPRVPILIAQHMPPLFTKSLANRLNSICGIPCDEGKDGQLVEPGKIYVAPGDYHMSMVQRDGNVYIAIDQGPRRNSVRPAVDPLFETAADIYGNGVLAVILTGMGEDGAVGCKAVKAAGGAVVIQDQESSVVWGMPGAVHAVGAFDKIVSLNECGMQLCHILSRYNKAT